MLTQMTYPQQLDALAHALMHCGAILTRESDHPLVVTRGNERGFTLKLHEKDPGAPLSPIYLNLRTPDNPKEGPLEDEIIEMAANCMVSLAYFKGLEFEAVAGVPRAGDPFTKAFANMSFPNTPIIGMEKSEASGQRRIATVTAGYLPPEGSPVLLLDDLVTHADSKVEAIQVLESANLSVSDVMVLVDRQQGGKEELKARGYELHSVFTISELLSRYVKSGKMSVELASEIKVYLEAN